MTLRRVAVLCSAALGCACAAPANPANGFDVEVDAMAGPDCLSIAKPFSVGVLDLAEARRGRGYLALVDVPIPPGDASVDVLFETFSLERGAFSDPALAVPRQTGAPAIFPTGEPATPFVLAPGVLALGTERAPELVDGVAELKMAGDAALANIIAEQGRVRLGIVAHLAGNKPPPACSFCSYRAAPIDQAPFQFQSADFSVDVDLCNGCLASPSSCPDGSAPIPNPASCNPGQDVPAEVCP